MTGGEFVVVLLLSLIIAVVVVLVGHRTQAPPLVIFAFCLVGGLFAHGLLTGGVLPWVFSVQIGKGNVDVAWTAAFAAGFAVPIVLFARTKDPRAR